MILICVCSVLVAFLVMWPGAQVEQGTNPLPKQVEVKTGSKNYREPDNNHAVKTLSTAKEGWGFVRSKNHQRPRISKWQESLLERYPAIFTFRTKEKEVVLTFDLGYEKGYTPKILDTLKAHGVPATFFVTGPWLRKHPDLSKRMVAEGHLIGNHTMTHPSLPALGREKFRQEIIQLENLLVDTTGVVPTTKVLRPPMGEYSEQTLQWTKELGYKTVFWSIALLDWKPLPGPGAVVRGVMANLHPGAVILLHGISKEVTEGLDELLDEMAVEGYKVVPLDKVKT